MGAAVSYFANGYRANTLARDSQSSEAAKFLATIAENAKPISAGTDIVFEGDRINTVIWVLQGWVSLSKILDDGRRQIIDIVLPIDLIRPISADRATSSFSITALTDGVISSCCMDRFNEQLAESDTLRGAVETLRAAANARQVERMLRLGQGTATERIAHALLELFVRLEAIHQTDKRTFHLPITQRDVGEFTGLTSVHVCRTFCRLVKEGIIRRSDHEIVVENVQELSRVGKVDLENFRHEILVPSFS